jgi:hypothetical protein
VSQWGQESDHEKHERLRGQAKRVKDRNRQALEASYRYYKERSEDKGLDAASRRLWEQLADELATRLGLNAPESVQERLL